MGKEKARGDLQKMVARESKLEIPKSAAEVKLRVAGSKVIEAFRKLAVENGELPLENKQ